MVKKKNDPQSQKLLDELRASIELNTLFMKFSPIYVYIKAVTQCESKVLMASENFADMVGKPGSEIIGKNMHDLFPAEFATKMTNDDWSVVSSQKVSSIEEELMGRHYSTIKFPIVMEDKTLLAGYTMDVTERKNAETKLNIRNEELKIINAQKDRLFSIISHDLINPFNSILGFSEILLEQVKEKNYEGIEEYAEIINHSSLRAMDLMKNLLDWSRIQTGRIRFNPVHLRMIDLINNALDLYTYITNQKSIQISSSLSSELIVYVDSNMMSTILRNLISNAIKFTKPGGEITIFTKWEQNELTISVADTGIGIPPKKLESLFYTDNTFSTSGTLHELGTGFGLILCKEFIEIHGGQLLVESTEGTGSVFSITLPFIKQP
ncbi:MAG: PAS domain-containing sensor histidine kinase [Prolixibacteraceae bacterium]